MKPYRGMLVATAVLLAALPLFSCGDADHYKKTEAIALTTSTDSVVVKTEAIFTVVQSSDPALGFNCETTLEYQATGAGLNYYWAPVPGSETTRVFKLRPTQVGTLSVIARGKCTGSNEDWKYSEQVDVTVTDPEIPQVAIELTAYPVTVLVNNPVTFTLSATKPVACTLKLKYQYSGAGFGITTVEPAQVGQFILTPHAIGELVVTATGWCGESQASAVSTTVSVPVTEEVPAVETITTPVTPTGPNYLKVNQPGTFNSVGSTSSLGHPLEYQFVATGPSTPENPLWTPLPEATISWSVANVVGSSYTVAVQARCSLHKTIVSAVSATKSVVVQP